MPTVICKPIYTRGSTSTCSETMTSGQWTMRSATSACHTVRHHIGQTVTLHNLLQDEMNELVEREEQEAVTEKEAAEAAAHLALMQDANLEVQSHPGG